jgi:DNA-binding GntR family transcriptional regulator
VALERGRRLLLVHPDFVTRDTEMHRQILRAVRVRDPAEASERMRDHLRKCDAEYDDSVSDG